MCWLNLPVCWNISPMYSETKPKAPLACPHYKTEGWSQLCLQQTGRVSRKGDPIIFEEIRKGWGGGMCQTDCGNQAEKHRLKVTRFTPSPNGSHPLWCNPPASSHGLETNLFTGLERMYLVPDWTADCTQQSRNTTRLITESLMKTGEQPSLKVFCTLSASQQPSMKGTPDKQIISLFP